MATKGRDWAIALLCASSTALALIATYSIEECRANGVELIDSGATLVPVQSTTVQLRHAWITVVLANTREPGSGHVLCDYELRNPSSHQANIEMAFVTGEKQGGAQDPVTTFRDSEFAVTTGGRALPIRMRPVSTLDFLSVVDSPPDSMPVWSVSIAPGSDQNLRISYVVTWSNRSDNPREERLRFKYNARPASLR